MLDDRGFPPGWLRFAPAHIPGAAKRRPGARAKASTPCHLPWTLDRAARVRGCGTSLPFCGASRRAARESRLLPTSPRWPDLGNTEFSSASQREGLRGPHSVRYSARNRLLSRTLWVSRAVTRPRRWIPARPRCRASSARPSSGCARPTICPCRNSAEQSGVAKSIISQIERNETNPTLATIWRLSQALDVSIERVLPPTKSPSSRNPRGRDTPILVSQDGSAARHHRLDQDGRMAAMVRCSRRAGRRAGFRRASARLGRMPVGDGRRVRGRGRRRRPARQGRRDAALPLRPAAHGPLRRRARATPPWSASSRLR